MIANLRSSMDGILCGSVDGFFHSGLKNNLDAAVFFVAEGLVELWTLLQGSGVGDDEGRVDLAVFDQPQEPGEVVLDRSCAILNVRPRLIAEPIGILSRNPPYTPTIETTPKLRQQ